MIKGSYDELKGYPETHRCPEHDNPLTVCWDAKENSHVIRCGHGHYPEEISPFPTVTELVKQGELTDDLFVDDVAKGVQKRAQAVTKVPPQRDLGLLLPYDVGSMVALTSGQVAGVIRFAHELGLMATLGHVCLMHGKPYIMADGYIYHAHKTKQHFSLTGRPLTLAELKAHGYQAGDIGYLSKVRKLDTGEEFEGYGFVTTSERTEMSEKKPGQLRYPVIAAKPGPMCVKRSEWQALKRAFPLGETEEVQK